MLTCLQMSIQVLVALTFLYLLLLLPSTMSMTLLSKVKSHEDERRLYSPHASSSTDWSPEENPHTPEVSKRHVSGADPWSLCPSSMERVDCFYEYLRVYARLRKAVAISDRASVRNIGKRSNLSTTPSSRSCLELLAPALCRVLDSYALLEHFNIPYEENKEEY